MLQVSLQLPAWATSSFEDSNLSFVEHQLIVPEFKANLSKQPQQKMASKMKESPQEVIRMSKVRDARCAIALRVGSLKELASNISAGEHLLTNLVGDNVKCKAHADPKTCDCLRDHFQSTSNSKRRVSTYLFWKLRLGWKFPISDDMLERRVWQNLDSCEHGIKKGNGQRKQRNGAVCVNPYHYELGGDPVKVMEPLIQCLIAFNYHSDGMLREILSKLVHIRGSSFQFLENLEFSNSAHLFQVLTTRIRQLEDTKMSPFSFDPSRTIPAAFDSMPCAPLPHHQPHLQQVPPPPSLPQQAPSSSAYGQLQQVYKRGKSSIATSSIRVAKKEFEDLSGSPKRKDAQKRRHSQEHDNSVRPTSPRHSRSQSFPPQSSFSFPGGGSSTNAMQFLARNQISSGYMYLVPTGLSNGRPASVAVTSSTGHPQQQQQQGGAGRHFEQYQQPVVLPPHQEGTPTNSSVQQQQLQQQQPQQQQPQQQQPQQQEDELRMRAYTDSVLEQSLSNMFQTIRTSQAPISGASTESSSLFEGGRSHQSQTSLGNKLVDYETSSLDRDLYRSLSEASGDNDDQASATNSEGDHTVPSRSSADSALLDHCSSDTNTQFPTTLLHLPDADWGNEFLEGEPWANVP